MKIIELIKPAPLLLSAIWAGIMEGTQKYLFADFEYLKFLLIATTIDLITGIAKAWAQGGHKAVTSKGIRMTVLKFIQYGAFLIITHVISSFTISGEPYPRFGFIKDWGYLLLLLVEVKSVYENIVAIDGRLDFVNDIVRKINKVIKERKKDDSPGDI